MSASPIFTDTLFFAPTALTATGVTATCVAVNQDNFAPVNFGFQVNVTTIGTSVVVRFEGSLDGTNFFNLAASDTTISSNGTTGYSFSNFPLRAIRGRLVTINTGTPTVAFIMSAK
jgi:hypothetical protein